MIVEHDVSVRHDSDDLDSLEVKRFGEYVKFVRERTCKMEVFSMHDEGDFTFRCSECGKGYVEYEPPNYCPNCGAKVVEE